MTRVTCSELDRKIATAKDPFEFVLSRPEGILLPTQLHTRSDVEAYSEAARASLRRAPSIIGIGEKRGVETL